jgi:DNA-binding NarL/FixJ family response regulator
MISQQRQDNSLCESDPGSDDPAATGWRAVPSSSLRIVLAEDFVLLREGIVELLHRFGHQVEATVGDADALIEAAERHQPDIVITDVRMPPDQTDDGLRAALALRGRFDSLPILILSQYVATAYAMELLTSDRAGNGGLGYLLKERISEVTEFLDAVRSVASGGTVVDPEVFRRLVTSREQPLDKMTSREHEVLALMAAGHSNASIEEALKISHATVAKHISSIFTKLGLSAEDGNRRVLAVLTYLQQS